MKQRFHSMKALYYNLRIKYKMFVLITVIMIAVGALSWVIAQNAFRVYDGEIYRQSAKALNLSSDGMENELKKMEQLTYRIAIDSEIQTSLFSIQQDDTEYHRFSAGNEMKMRMVDLGVLDKYVLSAQLISNDQVEYASGRKAVTTPLELRRRISGLAAEYQGGNRWIFPAETGDALMAAREIRRFENLSLDELGTIAVRVDMKSLFADYAQEGQEGTILIVNGDEVVYPEDNPFPLRNIRAGLQGSAGYAVIHMQGGRYFATQVHSEYTDWTYINVIPFNGIFHGIIQVKKLAILAYVCLFLLVIGFAMRFARGITDPIEILNAKMKKVRLGNFEHREEQDEKPTAMDEAGQLHRNFRIMLERINELIKENYQKQLTIKDTEFKALQAQINPHFLYNTLDSINWLAKLNGQRHISRMVESLAFLLRSSIRLKTPLIPLKQELEIVRHYITIQQIRFEERLDFALDIPAELSDYAIPKLSLQPIVENAVHYGLEEMTTPCSISIRASRDGDRLLLTVEDNGPGMEPSFLQMLERGEVKTRGSGIGLRNIDERIKLLFGSVYGIEIESKRRVGTRVHLILPCEKGEQSDVQSAAGR